MIGRRTVASAVHRVSGALVSGLMRSGTMFNRENRERWAADGFYVVPRNHFYYPLPDIAELRERAASPVPDPMAGIDLREAEQVALVKSFAAEYRADYERLAAGTASGYTLKNGTFESLDGILYWGMLKRFRPRRIVEIGSGNSTRLALDCLYGEPDAHLTVVDPYPSDDMVRLLSRHGSELMRVRLEHMGLWQFERLQENDILFIDGSHVVKSGGDVNRAILGILPLLAPGVIVHVHDVYLPYDYPPEVFEEGLFWSEQYLLQAFMAGNPRVEVLAGSSLLERQHQAELAPLFPMVEWVWGASFWFRLR